MNITINSFSRNRRQPDPFAEWIAQASMSAYRRACRAGRSDQDAADIAQEVAEYALNRGPAIAQAYVDPTLFAAARTYHAGVAWDRRNGAQSGLGANFGRSKTSLDAEFGEGSTLRDTLAADDDTAEAAERRLEADAVRIMLATTLDPRTAAWVWDVKALGMTVTEVAERDGVRREVVSRAVNDGVRELQQVKGEFLGG